MTQSEMPQWVAHRGAGIHAPENTWAAIEAARFYGFTAVEVDVMLVHSALILMHDEHAGRTLQGTQRLDQLPIQTLMQSDVGAWYSHLYKGQCVPVFEEIYAYMQRNAIWVNLEIKPISGYEVATAKHLIDALIAQPLITTNLPLLSSFSIDALTYCYDRAPMYPRAWLVDELPSNWLEQAQRLDIYSLHLNHDYLSQSQVHAIKEAGYKVLCYTVNDVARATTLLSWGVDSICTDMLAHMAKHNWLANSVINTNK